MELQTSLSQGGMLRSVSRGDAAAGTQPREEGPMPASNTDPAADPDIVRATMKDVARAADVSIKTVSRVVNGEASVAPDLAARVRTAVAALNYQPHLGASALRRGDGRSGTIGLLLEDVSNPFSASLHRAVEDEARARGVQVLTGSLDEDPSRERELTRIFTARRADGLIIAPVSADVSYLAAEVRTDTPVVFVDRPAKGIPADTVLATNVN